MSRAPNTIIPIRNRKSPNIFAPLMLNLAGILRQILVRGCGIRPFDILPIPNFLAGTLPMLYGHGASLPHGADNGNG